MKLGHTTLNNQPDEHQRRSTSGIDEQCTAHEYSVMGDAVNCAPRLERYDKTAMKE